LLVVEHFCSTTAIRPGDVDVHILAYNSNKLVAGLEAATP
jgi:hypothetical protein